MSCFSRLFGAKGAPKAEENGKPSAAASVSKSTRNKGSGERPKSHEAWGAPNGQADAGFSLPGALQEAHLSPKGEDANSIIQVSRNGNSSNMQDLELEDIANEFMVTEVAISSTPKLEESSRGSTPSVVSRPSRPASEVRDREAGPRPPSTEDVSSGVVVDWLDQEPHEEGNQSKVAQKIRWKKGELLGVGAFGKVFLGLNLDSGELMAVKVIPSVGGPDGDEYTQELIREISLMKVLFNEHIVRYIGTERDEAHLYIFLEYVPGGSIASVLHKFGKFSEGLVRAYTRQILVGLAYLHEHQIMHRDIKGANILISNDGIVKLADFGASKRITEMLTQNDCMSLKGTPYWMAPEVCHG